MSDKKILHIVSISTLVALVISFLIDNGGRILGAILIAIAAAVTYVLVKKRGVPSFYDKEVAMIMAVMALVYVMLYYLTGLEFGFVRTPYGLSVGVFLRYIIPIAAIIVSSEIIRNIMRAQESRAADILSYISLVVAEVVIHYSISQIFNFARFMDIIGLVFLPALLNNLLYHYLSKRYGILPNIAYRLITTLYSYIIPYKSRIADSLLAFVNLMVPILIFIFIDYLYEKKRRYALARNSKLSVILTAVVVLLMSSLIMLVSNSFRFGAYVIATESMTGELNKGDIAIYEEYDDQIIIKGQVIVFEKNGSNVIHRVVDVENINGQNRYYTKGDVNEDLDSGYITDGNIKGLVELKVPYLGFPTLWLRELVSKML